MRYSLGVARIRLVGEGELWLAVWWVEIRKRHCGDFGGAFLLMWWRWDLWRGLEVVVVVLLETGRRVGRFELRERVDSRLRSEGLNGVSSKIGRLCMR